MTAVLTVDVPAATKPVRVLIDPSDAEAVMKYFDRHEGSVKAVEFASDGEVAEMTARALDYAMTPEAF